MPSPTLVLKVTAELPPAEYQITAPTTDIGRLPSLKVPLPHRSVSREHAQISRVGEQFMVQDLGSKNGTWLNDQQVTAPTPLSDGDTLLIGDVPLLVILSRVDEPNTMQATAVASPPPKPATPIPTPPLPRGHVINPSTVMVGLDDVLAETPPGPAVQPRVLDDAPTPRPAAPITRPIAPHPPPPLPYEQPDSDDNPTVYEPLPVDVEPQPAQPASVPQPVELVPFTQQAEPAAATLARLAVTADSLTAALRSLSGDLATAVWLFEHAGGEEAAQAFIECVNAAYLHPDDQLAQQAVLDEAPTAARLLQAAIMVLRGLRPLDVDAAAGRRDET
jgi:predicted component of type VI protein secretion system